jgi:hypothetical protein
MVDASGRHMLQILAACFVWPAAASKHCHTPLALFPTSLFLGNSAHEPPATATKRNHRHISCRLHTFYIDLPHMVDASGCHTLQTIAAAFLWPAEATKRRHKKLSHAKRAISYFFLPYLSEPVQVGGFKKVAITYRSHQPQVSTTTHKWLSSASATFAATFVAVSGFLWRLLSKDSRTLKRPLK